MRALCITALLMAALTVGGCGGDAADAEETVSTAISGVAEGDGKQVCDQLTAGAQKQILAALADNPLLPRITASTCEDGIRKLHAKLSQAQRNVLVDGEVGDAKISGDTAKVRVIGLAMEADLEKIDGTWKITGGLFRFGGQTMSG